MVDLRNPVTTMSRQIKSFVKLSERRWGIYYQSMKTNEGVDIYYNFDIKEYIVKNMKNGMPIKLIYSGKNQFDALTSAKNHMLNEG